MSANILSQIVAKDEIKVEKIKSILKNINFFEITKCIITNKFHKSKLEDVECDVLIVDFDLVEDEKCIEEFKKDIFKDVFVVYYISNEHDIEQKEISYPYITDKFSIDKMQNILLSELFRKKLNECKTKNFTLKSLSIFTGGAAHDFNNIMGTIMGYTELLKYKVKGNQDVEKYIEFILKSCKKAHNIIEMLTDLSRNWEKQKKFKIPVHIILKETIRDLQNRYHIGRSIYEDIIKEDDLIEVEPSKLYLLCYLLLKNIMQVNKENEPIKIALNSVEGKHIGGKYTSCLELKISGNIERELVKASIDGSREMVDKIVSELGGRFEYIENDEAGILIYIPKLN